MSRDVDLSSVSDKDLQKAVETHPSVRTVRLCRDEIRRRKQIGVWSEPEEIDNG